MKVVHKFLVKCVNCHRKLGVYEGETFFIAPASPYVGIYCDECYRKLEGPEGGGVREDTKK